MPDGRHHLASKMNGQAVLPDFPKVDMVSFMVIYERLMSVDLF